MNLKALTEKAAIMAVLFIGGTVATSAAALMIFAALHLAASIAWAGGFVPPFPWPLWKFWSVFGAMVWLVLSAFAVLAPASAESEGDDA